MLYAGQHCWHFADNELKNYDPYSADCRERLNKVIRKYYNNSNIVVDSVETNNRERTYIHYTCPFSLFEEHIFPICVRSQIVACLMLGQMARGSFDRTKAFSSYRDNMKDKHGKAIDFANIEIVSCNDDEWDKKAKAIVERIITFENRLEERLNHRNTIYINHEFDLIEQIFRKEVQNIIIKEERFSFT